MLAFVTASRYLQASGGQDPEGSREERLSGVVGNCVAGSVLTPLVGFSYIIADSQLVLHGFGKCGFVTIGCWF